LEEGLSDARLSEKGLSDARFSEERLSDARAFASFFPPLLHVCVEERVGVRRSGSIERARRAGDL
jgi:hypothetical protein